MYDFWPLPSLNEGVKLKHPKYRPGWCFRDDELAHFSNTAKWFIENGEALFANVQPHSLLITSADKNIDELAVYDWLKRVKHLGLVIKKGTVVDKLIDELTNSPLTSLDLAWTSNDPAYPPQELARKTLGKILESSFIEQLSSFRCSCSSVKLIAEILSASKHIETLGLRLWGGFSESNGAKLASLAEMPSLKTLDTSSAIWPSYAPLLKKVRIRGGGLPKDSDISNLEHLVLDCIFPNNLEDTFSSSPLNMQSLSIVSGRADLSQDILKVILQRKFPQLTQLSVRNSPLTEMNLIGLFATDIFPKLRRLTIEVSSADTLSKLGKDFSLIEELSVSAPLDITPTIPTLTNLRRLSLGAICGERGDRAIEQALEQPNLVHFAMAHCTNQPSITNEGIKIILDKAPKSLKYLYLRLPTKSSKESKALRERFVVFDGGLKLASPFYNLCDWKYPWLSWGPKLHELNED